MISAILIGTAIMTSGFRQRAITVSTYELDNIVLLLSRHFDQQFLQLEATQKDLTAKVRGSYANSTADLKQVLARKETASLINSLAKALPETSGVDISDADGSIVATSEAGGYSSLGSVVDQPYFKDLKSTPNENAVAIYLARDHFTGKRVVVFARTLVSYDGRFLGILAQRIATEILERLCASMAIGNQTAIAIFHRDGTLLARYPYADELIGFNFRLNGGAPVVLDHGGHATLLAKSPVDNVERLGAIQALRSLPIMIVATNTVEGALANWRHQIHFLIGVAGALALVIAAMFVLVIRQVLRQNRIERRRQEVEKQRLDTAVDNMARGLVLFDASQRLVVCNRYYLDMFRLSADEVKPGMLLADLVQLSKAKGAFRQDFNAYQSVVEAGKPVDALLEIDENRFVMYQHQPLRDGGCVLTMEDVTERRNAEKRIAHLAHFDVLTDLPNRALFGAKLEGAMGRLAHGNRFAVLYIDVDEFKGINDSLGHAVGDELLKVVATRLRGCIEDEDFIARLGGDEFAIVHFVTSSESIVDLVAGIQAEMRRPCDCLGHSILTDASIGIALAPEHGVDIDQILRSADLAMYAAKSDGRRTYRFFEQSMAERVRARRAIEQDLRQIVERASFADDGFEVHYQPVVSIQTGLVTGCEALVRWRHPVRGSVSPAEFVPVMEETGLISALGDWVLATACREAAGWPGNIRVAVNVSPVQFRSRTLGLKVASALDLSGLLPGRLELEITEAVLIRDDEVACATLNEIRALGVRMALDDFGTGYSSLSYLHRFPFDKIKIDRSFVSKIEDRDGRSIVQAVVNIAATRNMATVAEGVEREAQRNILLELGCTEMQGYLFSPAKPAEEIRGLLAVEPDGSRSATEVGGNGAWIAA